MIWKIGQMLYNIQPEGETMEEKLRHIEDGVRWPKIHLIIVTEEENRVGKRQYLKR